MPSNLNLHNLHKRNPKDFHPKNHSIPPEVINSNLGLLLQNSQGIYDAYDSNKNIIAPFNISCFIHNYKMYILVIEAASETYDTTVTQFCSYVSHKEFYLPKATYQACKYVSSNFPVYANILNELIISGVGIELYEEQLVCTASCVEKAHLLYDLAKMKDFSDSVNNRQDGEPIEGLPF